MISIIYILPHGGKTSPNCVVKNLINSGATKGDFTQVLLLKHKESVIFDKFLTPKSFFNLSRFDVFHTHGFLADLIGFILSFFYSSRIVTTLHSVIEEDLKERFGFVGYFIAKLWLLILSRHDEIIVLNNLQKQLYSRYFNGKVKVIPNGFDVCQVNELSPSVFKLENYGKKVILCHGVVRRIKSFDFILDCFLQSDWLSNNFVFVLVGDGPELDKLKKKYAQLLDEKIFISVGFKSDALQYLRLADFFVMSSFFEGVPISMFEAVACNIPVLCVNEPSFHGLFSESEVFYFSRTTDSFVSLLKKLLILPEVELEQQTKRAFISLQNNFSLEVQYEKYRRVY